MQINESQLIHNKNIHNALREAGDVFTIHASPDCPELLSPYVGELRKNNPAVYRINIGISQSTRWITMFWLNKKFIKQLYYFMNKTCPPKDCDSSQGLAG